MYKVGVRTRFADGYSVSKRIIVEMKDKASVHLTRQIRDALEFAKRKGFCVDVICRENTVVSKPLAKAIEEEGGMIVKILPKRE